MIREDLIKTYRLQEHTTEMVASETYISHISYIRDGKMMIIIIIKTSGVQS